MEFKHYPVMSDEITEALQIVPDGIYADCTLGGCGHTKRILSKLNERGRVIGIDLDSDAIENAKATVKAHDERLLLWKGNFKDIRRAVGENGYDKINGALFDLGVSSYQIDNAARGFSYIHDAPLDMRMDATSGMTAADVVNTYPEKELARVFFEYGEEKFSRRISEKIVALRAEKPILTTTELADIITGACPGYYKKDGHPARRCFQALRIEVNGELDGLKQAVEDAISLLVPGGRVAIISFHSLEDRIVKTTLNSLENPCVCPKDFPICVCGKTPSVKVITRKCVTASEKENAENSRSHSAKLRIAEKL